jgi:hypothetical protein
MLTPRLRVGVGRDDSLQWVQVAAFGKAATMPISVMWIGDWLWQSNNGER